MNSNGTGNLKTRERVVSIWLTRPRQQAEILEQLLNNAGYRVLHLPMMEIVPLEYSQAIRNTILELDRYQVLIFISTNAARLGMACIEHFWPQFPADVDVFAVGPTTASLLQGHGLNVYHPLEGMSSEALLELPELQTLKQKKVLIIRGVGGRELIAQALRERGAVVDYVELYRRDIPGYPAEYILECLEQHVPDGIVITSAEALHNLVTTLSPYWRQLEQVRLFVSSERIAREAASLGFSSVTVMPGANDETILSSLDEIYG